VQRFRRGFMPNSTLHYLASLTPAEVDGVRCDVTTIDEYVHADLRYLELLRRDPERPTLVAFAGVQSHQFHRALDLAAFARSRGVEGAVIGGPHPMTCDTSELHGRDARWTAKLDPPPLIPPSKRDLKRYAIRCYREFYSAGDSGSRIARSMSRCDYRTAGRLMTVAGYTARARISVMQRQHPMAGGSGRVRLDRAQDYAALRRKTFGFDLAPLPRGLPLWAPDEALNRQARLA
jgi:hypothetical protein